MIEGIVETSERKPYVTVGIVSLITLAMIFGATHISMTSETEQFLPEDYTSVQVAEEYENEVGTTLSEIILVEGDNLTSSSSFRSIFCVANELSNNPSLENYVENVSFYPSYLIPRLENYSGSWENLSSEQLEAQIQALVSKPEVMQQINALLSQSRKAALINVSVNTQLSSSQLHTKTEELHQFTQEFEENCQGLELSNTGSLSMEIDTQNMMNRDNQVLIPAAIIFIIIILYLAFRKLSDTGLPFLVLGLGAVWMIGTMGFLGINFNMMFVALVPIILGIGIDYTIHMLNRYYEERGNGLKAELAALTSVKTVGVAVLLTAVTTMVGFASFGVSDMPPIQNFGFLAAAGVFYIFILATTFLPSLITLRDRGGEAKSQTEKVGSDRIGKALSKLELGLYRHGKPILVGAGIIAVLSIVPTLGLTTTMSFDTFLPQGAESIETMQDVQEHFGAQGSQSRIYVLARGDVSKPANLQLMLSLESSVKSDPRNNNLILRSSSVADLIMYFTGGEIPQNATQIEMILSNLKNERPEQLERLLISENKTAIYFTIKAETDREMREATHIIKDHVENFAAQETTGLNLMWNNAPAVSGSPVIFSDIMESVKPNMRNSIILAIILVLIVISLVFRSIWIGLIGALPVSLALLWEFGTLGTIGWPLDVMNMMVSAIAIGIGVDFSIHVIDRFKEEWKEKGKSPEKAISITVQSVGRAIMAAAATTVGVFLILSLSRMPPITRFGQLSALVIIFSLVGALVVLPSALLAYARRKE